MYKAHIDREGVTPVAVEDGQHNADFLKSRKYFIDTYSKVNQEPVITLKDNTGKTLLKLSKPDLSNVKAKGWVAQEPFSVMAADDRTELFGVMYKPANFGPKKKYPIVSVVYPGPYYGFVPTAFALSENHCSAMAQLGMIVIKVGPTRQPCLARAITTTLSTTVAGWSATMVCAKWRRPSPTAWATRRPNTNISIV